MEEKIVIANLKMNLNITEMSEYLKRASELLNDSQVVFCPTNIYIPYFLKKKFGVGVQNIYYEDNGAFTGELSPLQAKQIGVEYTIIGHSERRIYFDETDSIVNKKIKAALKNNLKVILCVGETKEERDMLKTDKIIKRQLINCLRDIEDISNIIIAYEPVWAIGTSVTPTKKEIQSITTYIGNIVKTLYEDIDLRIVYGGSVNSKNIEMINSVDNIYGVLVGGASLNIDELVKIKEVVIK